MTRSSARPLRANSCAQRWVIFQLAAMLSCACGCESAPPEPLALQLARRQFPLTPGSDAERGLQLASTRCTECHAPGVFRSWPFHYRSTPSGEPPTLADLLRVVEQGIPGTRMTGYAHLPPAARWALAAWVQHEAQSGRLERLLALRARAGELLTDAVAANEAATVRHEFDNRDRALEPPPEPTDRQASARSGAALYGESPSLCIACHGVAGQGDGPRAKELVDDLGRPAPPRDFRSGVFRGGGTGRDLFLRIKCGVGGTPMPSFQSALTDTQIWHLVHFIQSLAHR